MKLLFNLEVLEGSRIKARPSDYLKSLPVQQQLEAVREFLEKHNQQQSPIITDSTRVKRND